MPHIGPVEAITVLFWRKRDPESADRWFRSLSLAEQDEWLQAFESTLRIAQDALSELLRQYRTPRPS